MSLYQRLYECLYHATPLHYLPHVLACGALYPQSVLAARGVRPRRTAARRDRMLGLTDWVHLSLVGDTPLLRDKMGKGFPHALLAFEHADVLALPHVALLPFNTKAWKSRADCRPVTDDAEKTEILRRHADTGRFPSLEVLIRYGLGLETLTQIAFPDGASRDAVAALLDALSLPPPAPLSVNPALFPALAPPPLGDALRGYFAACRAAGTLLPPPDLPFD